LYGDPIPNITSARLVIEFADGRACVFEAKDPGPAEVQFEYAARHDRFLDQEQPVSPELIHGLALVGETAGITLRIKAARNCVLRYLDVPRA